MLFCLLLAFASAQPPQPSQTVQQIPAGAELAEIRFEGISDPSIESLVQVRLVSRPGVSVADIDLPAERNRVDALGTFS